MKKQRLNHLICTKCGKHFQKGESDVLCYDCRQLWYEYWLEHELDKRGSSMGRDVFIAVIWEEFLARPFEEKVQFT